MDSLNLDCLIFVFGTTIVACFIFYLSSLTSEFPDFCLCWFRTFVCFVPKKQRRQQYIKVLTLDNSFLDEEAAEELEEKHNNLRWKLFAKIILDVVKYLAIVLLATAGKYGLL